MVEFGGFDMPLHYTSLEQEHAAVRNHCGIFDVSHMGEVNIAGPDAERFIDHIFTGQADAILPGKISYGMMLNAKGGIIDDLLVYGMPDKKYLLVINASNIDKDLEHIYREAENFNVTVTNLSDCCAQIALQGPESPALLEKALGINTDDLAFYTFKIHDGSLLVSRTGYTGEDGFEIYAHPEIILELWDKLVAAGATPCGLGCRDTLRFEAGLPLYGMELGEDITPLEASLGMFVKLDKPNPCLGAETLKAQKANGVGRRIIGLEINSPAPGRHGYNVLDTEGKTVGVITTGYTSPTLKKNIAMAMVETPYTPLGTSLQVQVRRRNFPATVVKKRFYTPNYKK